MEVIKPHEDSSSQSSTHQKNCSVKNKNRHIQVKIANSNHTLVVSKNLNLQLSYLGQKIANMSGNVIISFQRTNTKISQNTCDFLCAKLNTNEDESLIRNIQLLTSGQLKKLKVEEANLLLKKLLLSIIIDDNLDETSASEIEAESDFESSKENDSDEGGVSEADPNNTIKNRPNNGADPGLDPMKISSSTPGQTQDPLEGTSKRMDLPKLVNTKKTLVKKTNQDIPTCKFYANGRCNKNNDCKFLHPRICRKFNQFGNKQDNAKGCQGNCGFFHPNACRSSLKDRTCAYKECRFYHLSGTKNTIYTKPTGPRNSARKNQTQFPKINGQKINGKFASKNRFADLEAEATADTLEVKQDFHKGQTKITDTLTAIMTRLAAMEEKQNLVAQRMSQIQNQNFQVQPAFRPAYLSPIVAQPGALTQAQWASQNQLNQSQSQY